MDCCQRDADEPEEEDAGGHGGGGGGGGFRGSFRRGRGERGRLERESGGIWNGMMDMNSGKMVCMKGNS